MKIATWNVNSLRVRLGHVCEWLDAERPDVLALQETKLRDEDFPTGDFATLGYSAFCNGQPAYNGVALVVRGEARDLATEFADFEDPARRILAATVNDMRVVNIYVPNGQSVGSEKYAHKLVWLRALRRQLIVESKRNERCIVLGDFNIAPEDRDVYDPAAWKDKVLCSEPERAALASILELGFVDVFRKFEQPQRSFSWWDYRAAAFRRNRGLRIDLILATASLGATCRRCVIDPGPRRRERPSDHTPVLAEFEGR